MLNTTGLTPCAKCPKIPDEVYDESGKLISKTVANTKRVRPHAAEFTPRIAQAYRHYRECRAVNQFPDDPIVRANAVHFQDAEEMAKEYRQAERDENLIRLAIIAAKQGRR